MTLRLKSSIADVTADVMEIARGQRKRSPEDVIDCSNLMIKLGADVKLLLWMKKRKQFLEMETAPSVKML